MRLLPGDCVKILPELEPVDCIFADPPDNIGLRYAGEYPDDFPLQVYRRNMRSWVLAFVRAAPVVWLSFNSRHLPMVGAIVDGLVEGGLLADWKILPCVQTFTFGQHNHHDLGNNHRPLWRLMAPGSKLYPDSIRVESERQRAGDKRADPRGRVPGDVFDIPRVTGNSKQRRAWHPTQLHEGLVERCLRLTTQPGQHVLDPFGGTGTTARVCKQLDLNCTLIEVSPNYCELIKKDLIQ